MKLGLESPERLAAGFIGRVAGGLRVDRIRRADRNKGALSRPQDLLQGSFLIPRTCFHSCFFEGQHHIFVKIIGVSPCVGSVSAWPVAGGPDEAVGDGEA